MSTDCPPQTHQATPGPSYDIVSQTVVSDLDISLHPLPILNISDHLTRTRLQTGKEDVKIYGALIGTQIGRKVEIVNCFEILVDENDGKVNHGFLKTRQEQFQQVFPTLDLLGWYSIGSSPTPADLKIQQQLNEHPEFSSSLLLLYSYLSPEQTLGSSSNSSRELPISLYEFTASQSQPSHAVQVTSGAGGQGYVKCTYDVQSSEAERIAVDHVAKPNVGSGESALVANLTTQRNATKMLHSRLEAIVEYLNQVILSCETREPGSQTKVDHGLLREISSLVACLPNPNENPFFKHEYMAESNDALLTSYLSAQSKLLNETNQLIDRYIYINVRENDSKAGNNGRMHDSSRGHKGFDSGLGGRRR